MNIKMMCGLTLGAALTAGLNLPVSAVAQTQSPDTSELTEIIVTARRTEERLQDVPISITVFNQEQLTNRNVTNAVDLANFTPSLSTDSQFGTENTSFAIRGFSQEIGTQPSVGAYFGDVVAPRGPTPATMAGDSIGPGSFFDLQNVQVLKGPQGTLFGRNTTGGAVLLVPQKPTSNLESYAEASYGNYDMYRVQGALNVPFSESVLFRIAADHQQRDGYLENISGIGPKDYQDVNYVAARASLVVDLTANLENYTIASYSKSDTNGATHKLVGCDSTGFNAMDPAGIAAGMQNFMGVFSCAQLADEQARGAGFYDVQSSVRNPVSLLEQWQVINTTTWRPGDTLTIKNIASYAELKNEQRTPLFGTNWRLSTLPPAYQMVFQAGIPPVFATLEPAPGLYGAHQNTYTEELQLQGSAAEGRLTYQAGAYFEWSDPLSASGNQTGVLASCTDVATFNCYDPLGITFTGLTAFQLSQLGLPPPYPDVHVGVVNYNPTKTTYRDRGLYTQATYELTNRLKLTGGVRYTWDEQTSEATRISFNFPVSAPFTGGPTASCVDPSTIPTCHTKITQKSDEPTWLIGLDYKPTDDMLIYGKYARGYRAGGVFVTAPIDYQTYDPEQVDNY